MPTCLATPRAVAEDRAPEKWIAPWTDSYNACDLEALLAWLHPEVEFRPLLVGDREPVYRGHDGFIEWFQHARSPEPAQSLVVHEVRALPPNRVLIAGTIMFGRTARAPFCGLHEFRDGLVVKVQHWLTTPDALRHVGHID